MSSDLSTVPVAGSKSLTFNFVFRRHLPVFPHEAASLADDIAIAKSARKAEGKALKAVCNAAAIGGQKYRKAQSIYLKSYHARVWNVLDANFQLPVAKRFSLKQCIAAAEDFNPVNNLIEEASVDFKPKAETGKYRPIWNFGLKARAAQRMWVKSVDPMMPQRPDWLFTDSKGGVPACIHRAIHLLESGFIYGVELDIRDFYGSFRKEHLLLKLPGLKVAANTTARAAGITPVFPGGTPMNSSWSTKARRGIPQGAASSNWVARWCVSQMDIDLPDTVEFIVYADNFFLFGKAQQEVEEAAKTLTEALSSAPGGHFKFKAPVYFEVHSGFVMLGHFVLHTGLDVEVGPTEKSAERFRQRFCQLQKVAEKRIQIFKCSPHDNNGVRAAAAIWRLAMTAKLWFDFYSASTNMPDDIVVHVAKVVPSLMSQIPSNFISSAEDGSISLHLVRSSP